MADVIRTALGATTKHVIIAHDPNYPAHTFVVGPVMSAVKAREAAERLQTQGFTVTYAPAALYSMADLTALEANRGQ